MSHNTSKCWEDRLEIRLAPEAMQILKRAAFVEYKTVSAFILDKSLAAAGTAIRRVFF